MTLALAIAGALALAQLPDTADAGVRRHIDQTPHNLFGVGGHSSREDTDLCELCHVQNRLANRRLAAPAWEARVPDKHLGPERNAGLDVRADPNGPPLALRWAGSTLRCLSCHDETVSSIGVVFRPASLSLVLDQVAGDHRRAQKIGGPALDDPQLWLGRVMGNHPVSVPYPLGLGEYRGFVPRATRLDPSQWVEDPRAKGLKLLSDTSGFDLLRGTVGVECSSCHDPHGTANTYFLRLSIERSALCLGCHRK
ncbi:MAG: cytochrome c3 family protein [Myxococcaceae bacterium]